MNDTLPSPDRHALAGASAISKSAQLPLLTPPGQTSSDGPTIDADGKADVTYIIPRTEIHTKYPRACLKRHGISTAKLTRLLSIICMIWMRDSLGIILIISAMRSYMRTTAVTGFGISPG